MQEVNCNFNKQERNRTWKWTIFLCIDIENDAVSLDVYAMEITLKSYMY